LLFRVRNFIAEFNELSKSGLGVEISHTCAKIYSHFFIAKPAKSQLFEKIEKIEILKFLHFFIENSILSNFLPKLIENSPKI
jgi:hypothetical protein